MASSSTTGWAAWRHRDFVLVFMARFLNTIASFSQQVVIGWEMWVVTHDETYLGLIGLFAFAPNLMFFMVAGTVADRYPRRVVLSICYGLQTCAAIFLLLAFTADDPQGIVALCVIFLTGLGRTFSAPASQSLLPNVVPKEDFANAVAWANSGGNLAQILGPMIGGALLLLGPTFAFVTIACVFAFNMLLVVFIRTRGQAYVRGPVTFKTLAGGVIFIWQRKIVLGAISLDLVAVIFGSCTALLPVYATDILHVGELGLGFLRAVMAVGSTLCALLLTRIPIQRNAGKTLLATIVVFGASLAVFGFSTWLPLSLVALFVAGASDMISVFIRDNLIQFATPDEMRGRVNAVNSMFTMGSGDIGQLKSGFLASWIGPVPAVVVGAIGTILVTLSFVKLFPGLGRVDALDPDEIAKLAAEEK
jgi:MFS family permease